MLITSKTRILVVRSNFVNLHGFSAQYGENESMAEKLVATEMKDGDRLRHQVLFNVQRALLAVLKASFAGGSLAEWKC